MENKKIVMIGCGNVASYFAERFKLLNYTITQVYHPELSKAEAFSQAFSATAFDDLHQINNNADIYFIAVKDSAIEAVANQIPSNTGIVMHSSGAVKIEVLNKHKRAAVFYPLQTFTKGIKMANENFPIFIECNEKADESYLSTLAFSIGNSVHFLNSNQRTAIHLAAVFAANFSNHCIKIAYDLMQANKFEAAMLLPLIKEGINKLNYIAPAKAQTGPAIRHDESTIEKHLEMLHNDDSLKLIYEQITKHIQSSNS